VSATYSDENWVQGAGDSNGATTALKDGDG